MMTEIRRVPANCWSPKKTNGELDEALWYQLYRDIPISPPFSTKEELAKYWSENGDFWYQHRLLHPENYKDCLEYIKPTFDSALKALNHVCPD